jgi:hypothetical protein
VLIRTPTNRETQQAGRRRYKVPVPEIEKSIDLSAWQKLVSMSGLINVTTSWVYADGKIFRLPTLGALSETKIIGSS